jgi:hypothetical protein
MRRRIHQASKQKSMARDDMKLRGDGSGNLSDPSVAPSLSTYFIWSFTVIWWGR